MVKGKRILLGITGGIAAYKGVEAARGLVKMGALVRVVMTANACRFVTPLTFAAVTGRPAFTDETDFVATGHGGNEMSHISLARESDLVLIAPATANIIGKMAHGIADDLLSTLLLVARPPILIAPAMNCLMYDHPAVQENLRILERRGIVRVGPCSGDLACGEEGMGRMADISDIIERVEQALFISGELQGKRFLITAGPTREPIDPVRFITNRSSGRMGYAMAHAAVRRGARVTLVSGPTSLPLPAGLEASIPVTTAAQMREAVLSKMEGTDVLVMTAAVADYRPVAVAGQKIKKEGEGLTVTMEKTEDILAEAGRQEKRPILMGFAAETENVIENALDKCRRKNLDLIVANDVSRQGTGFDAEVNEATVITQSGDAQTLLLMSKQQMAEILTDRISALLRQRKN